MLPILTYTTLHFCVYLGDDPIRKLSLCNVQRCLVGVQNVPCIFGRNININKKAVLSQRLLRDVPTKVNKQPHVHLRNHVTLGRLSLTGQYGRRC